MRTVCIYRKDALKNYRGKKVKWIMCKKCRQDMIDFYVRNLDVFIRSETKRFAADAALPPTNTTVSIFDKHEDNP